jgi:hypothetical protein
MQIIPSELVLRSSYRRVIEVHIAETALTFTSYEHLITGSKVTNCPVETVGGILADDMGLGKTLTMISTIVRTADTARLFAQNSEKSSEINGGEHSKVASRSTLVIIPSPCESLCHPDLGSLLLS